LTILFFVIALSVACLLYYAMISPERFGAYHDDGIYVTTAKALATGQGYRIISLPYEPAQTKYPPFYPFLLSLIWRVYPHFPQNLVPMILLSILATLAFLVLTWRYLVSQGYGPAWQALIVVALSAINWRMMILATAIYSEMVYAALSVVGLYLAEKYEKEQKGRAAGLVLGVVLGLVFLTRSSGLALLIAVAAYYVLRRQWKKSLLPVSVGGAIVVGWIAWCYFNKTSVDGINVAYYTSYLGHLNQVISDLQLHSNSSRLTIFMGIVFENLIGGILISLPLICSGINYSWVPSLGGPLLLIGFFFVLFTLLLIGVGVLRSMSKGFRRLHFYVSASLG
jgi:4-amino-4-deoxy-L-arabinose transferase-like glycosyltransferase